MGNTAKIAESRAEAARLGITVEPPSINRSGVDFDVAGNTIRYALAAIKGVGQTAIETIVAVRDPPFAAVGRFPPRVNARALHPRVPERVPPSRVGDQH